MKLIGLDVGDVHIGCAVGDTLTRIATPFRTLHVSSRTEAIEEILRLVHETEAQALVLGIPKRVDDTESKQAAAIRSFSERLGEKLTIPLFFVDEKYTTLQAQRMCVSEAKESEHEVAAMLILQSYLDKP